LQERGKQRFGHVGEVEVLLLTARKSDEPGKVAVERCGYSHGTSRFVEDKKSDYKN
jgi:hypothetical protein